MALGKNCCFSLEGPILNNTVIRKSSKENDGREFVPSLLNSQNAEVNRCRFYCLMLRGLSPVLEAISPVTSTPWKA